jgi:hypothetical protein
MQKRRRVPGQLPESPLVHTPELLGAIRTRTWIVSISPDTGRAIDYGTKLCYRPKLAEDGGHFSVELLSGYLVYSHDF